MLIKNLVSVILEEKKNESKRILKNKNLFKRIIPIYKRKRLPEEYLSLELLYRRTFEDISNTQSAMKSITTEMKGKVDFTFSLIIVIGGLVAYLNTYFPFINKDKISSLLGFITTHSLEKLVISLITVILPLWLFIRIFIERTSERKFSSEYNAKTLYDDEIAEERLKEAIQSLSNMKNHYKIVFVIDELDKFEDFKSLKELLGQLKPLMLSGKATFLLVGGQKLYYLYEAEQLEGDSLFNSTFSKNIHVPLPKDYDFRNYIDRLGNNNTNIDHALLLQYTRALILKSNRSLRTFISLVKQSIEWEVDTNKPYISLSKSRVTMLQSDLLKSMERVLNDYMTEDDEESNDFFITQLHIVIKKMQLMQGGFTKDNILKKDMKLGCPKWYWERLDKLVDLLLNEMVNNDLIDVIKENGEDKTSQFRWKRKIEIFFAPEFKVIAKSFNVFFEDLQNIIIGCFKEYFPKKKVESFFYSYKDLSVEGLKVNEEIDSLIKESDKINEFLKDGEEYVTTEAIRELQSFKNRLMLPHFQIIKAYTELILAKRLTNYVINKQEGANDTGLDIVAVNKNGDDILFVLKYYTPLGNLSHFIRSKQMELKKAKQKYETTNQKESKLVVLIFVPIESTEEQLGHIRKVISKTTKEEKDISMILLNVNRSTDTHSLVDIIDEYNK